jgi:hypothetical protein
MASDALSACILGEHSLLVLTRKVPPEAGASAGAAAVDPDAPAEGALRLAVGALTLGAIAEPVRLTALPASASPFLQPTSADELAAGQLATPLLLPDEADASRFALLLRAGAEAGGLAALLGQVQPGGRPEFHAPRALLRVVTSLVAGARGAMPSSVRILGPPDSGIVELVMASCAYPRGLLEL